MSEIKEIKNFMCYLCSKAFKTDEYIIEDNPDNKKILGICPFCQERFKLKVYSDAREIRQDIICSESITNLYEVYVYDIEQHVLFSSL